MSLDDFKRAFGLGDDALESAAAAVLQAALSGGTANHGVTAASYTAYVGSDGEGHAGRGKGPAAAAARDMALVDLFCSCITGTGSEVHPPRSPPNPGPRTPTPRFCRAPPPFPPTVPSGMCCAGTLCFTWDTMSGRRTAGPTATRSPTPTSPPSPNPELYSNYLSLTVHYRCSLTG